ncbi:Hypothetical predicted protein [Lecanosticta acicola]|uniref:Uncharacterized protein n=1 Tax=Lecanosticta acicola TaxID=111012 RepID=A0AAI8W124_9PEZI|nr:Hypothetical predicted protein [Lecanosticta acicola]
MTQTTFHTEEIHAIKSLIQAFFDRINASDPSGLQTLFVPHAHLTIIRQDPPALPPPPPSTTTTTTTTSNNEAQKLTLALQTSIESFIEMLQDGSKPPGSGPVVHEMPDLDATDVRVDGLFACAWCPFRVTFDGALHHFGNFVFTLGKVDGGDGGDGNGDEGGKKKKKKKKKKEWRFEGLTQNYRRTPGWEGEGQQQQQQQQQQQHEGREVAKF